MAQQTDVKTMIASLLRVDDTDNSTQDVSRSGQSLANGFDNDNPITFSALYRDEQGRRLPSKLHVVPLFGRPILPSQTTSVQLNVEWMDIISEIIASPHHCFAMFAVSESKVDRAHIVLDDFPETGTMVRLISAHSSNDEITIVCEGLRRVGLLEVSDARHNLADVHYPEIEYNIANPTEQDKLNTNSKALRDSLERYSQYEHKLTVLCQKQEAFAKHIGVDIVRSNSRRDAEFFLSHGQNHIGIISNAKFSTLLDFAQLNDLSKEERQALAIELARPDERDLAQLRSYQIQIQELVSAHFDEVQSDLRKISPEAASMAALFSPDNNPSLQDILSFNSPEDTKGEKDDEKDAKKKAKSNTIRQLIKELKTPMKKFFDQERQPYYLGNATIHAKTDLGDLIDQEKALQDEKEHTAVANASLHRFLTKMSSILDSTADSQNSESHEDLNDNHSREDLFDLLQEVGRKETERVQKERKDRSQKTLDAIIDASPKDPVSGSAIAGPNFGFVNDDTTVVTFTPGQDSSEDLLVKLTELQKEQERLLQKNANAFSATTITSAITPEENETTTAEDKKTEDAAKKTKTKSKRPSTKGLNPKDLEEIERLQSGTDVLNSLLDDMYHISDKSSKWSDLQRAGMIRAKLAKLLGGKVVFGVSNLMGNQQGAQREVECRAYCLGITSALQELLPLNPVMSDDMRQYIARFDMSDPSVLADCAAAVTQSKPAELQKVLDTVPVLPRLKISFELITRELSAAKLQDKIKMSVAEKISKRQKEFFLREQLTEIKKELGLSADEKDIDVEKFQQRMSKLHPPKHIKERFDDELNKLSLLDTASPEYGVTRNYIDIITSIPWGKMAKERFNLDRARKILDKDHEGLQDVKDRIIEFLAVGALKGQTRGQIMLFVGPPGVGKTSIGKSIAQALNRPFYRLSLGGIDDVSEIKGHRKTYVGAMPGKIVSALRETKVMNPVIMLDEIDKLGKSYHGDPDSALLETLDPEQNSNFLDVYLDEKLDLSNCLFICTANSTDTISAPLLDRMDPIRLSGYIAREKFAIARKHLLPRALTEAGISKSTLQLPDDTLNTLIEGYARESGVRSLERSIAKLIRKSAVKLVEGEKSITITPDDLESYLGTAPFKREKMLHGVGIMTGLAWTASGGVTLPVESIVTSKEAAGFTLTGSLGDVMKESATIAFSFIKSHLERYTVKKNAEFFKKKTVHLHVPEGAIPKDGPSAGVTMASSLLSLALDTAPKSNFAMTGELTLTGHVLPIGGLREKVIAARRMGIFDLIIPIGNEGDVKELPKQVRNKVTFYLADTYDDVAWILFDAAQKELAAAGHTAPKSLYFEEEISEDDAEEKKASSTSKKVKAPVKKAPAKKAPARSTRAKATTPASKGPARKSTKASTSKKAPVKKSLPKEKNNETQE